MNTLTIRSPGVINIEINNVIMQYTYAMQDTCQDNEKSYVGSVVLNPTLSMTSALVLVNCLQEPLACRLFVAC